MYGLGNKTRTLTKTPLVVVDPSIQCFHLFGSVFPLECLHPGYVLPKSWCGENLLLSLFHPQEKGLACHQKLPR